MCYMHCSSAGAAYMALEFGFVCSCGSGKEDEYTRNKVDTCDTKCAGDRDTTCGKQSTDSH